MQEAHTGLITDPSAPGEVACKDCHTNFAAVTSACEVCHASQVQANANSIHTNQWGYKKAIEDRCGCTFEGAGLDASFAQNCGSCHTTCGQCHVSRPASVAGGFPKFGGIIYSAHRFNRTPDMTEQCTACHGSRVGTDFLGQIAGNLQDVHRSKGYNCTNCHTGQELHGDGQEPGAHYEHRYQVATMPRCEDCHGSETGWANEYHTAHVGVQGANLQCQVCHSQPYKNCTDCHNLRTTPGTGEGFEIEPSRVQLKIAKNPSPYRTEYDYALVRHTPIDPDTYANWGLALPQYTSKPTWQYTSPHNILRRTTQTTPTVPGECASACHDQPNTVEGIFLREIDLYEADGVTPLPDRDANIGIVIPVSGSK